MDDVAAAGSPVVDRVAEFEAVKRSALAVLQAAAGGQAVDPAASQRSSSSTQLVAREALALVLLWECPVQRINAPPPSPFWRMLGLQS